MKVVYHERYREVYSGDPAARPGRMESICRELYDHFEFVGPDPTGEEDLKLAHTENHISPIVHAGKDFFKI